MISDDRIDGALREFLAVRAADTAGLPTVEDLVRGIQRDVAPTRRARQPSLAWIAVAAILLLMAWGAFVFAGAALRTDEPVRGAGPTNGWIAFSTQPGTVQVGSTDYDEGGDIYLVRPGVDERLIVSRGEDKTWNVCPLFSPDGSKLVYGERDSGGSALVILSVTTDGSVTGRSRLAVPAGAAAPCPGWWSEDGSVVGYLQFESSSYVENPAPSLDFRGVDGATPTDVPDAPTAERLLAARDESGLLLSPLGDRITEADDRLVVIRRDGSRNEIFGTVSVGYSIPAWSPDGRQFLVMSDGGRGFAMTAFSTDRPGSEIVVFSALVNGVRSFPGRGDVSWQAVYP